MQPKDVHAVLKPFYDKFDELCEKGEIDEAVKYYHSQGVVVKTGESVAFGRDQISHLFKQYWEKIGPHKFVLTNDVYQGTDDYLIVHSDFHVDSGKGSSEHKGKFIHIWTKEDGKWVIYHEEFEMN
ncbi:hypothetical protein TELCIR_00174 [Teladorsagia circumcincta]|uniref:SnoaL-like domain-containing protein n=1 Tax=Teladorsagia circumcincta TaxID=45464 RepID=A0A2G9V5A7_TELCI|nr:hypothetical protein TELCIR_00174 [Teladorsagia circumcincta]